MNGALRFRYRAADGEESDREVTSWREEGHYIIGFDTRAAAVRTFRKDRVLEWLDGCETALQRPYAPPPTLQRAVDDRAQILFTGFARVQRAVLEAKAAAAGLRVMKIVAQDLLYLVAGPNAGPAKVAQARMQHVYILSESQFYALLATGELPDDEVADLVM